MSSTRFRLARLQALKTRLEERRRQELARELGEQRLRIQALEEARGHLEEAREQLGQELEQGLQVSRWSLLSGYLSRQESVLALRNRRLVELEPRLRVARERLLEALKERRVLDRLEENWQEDRALEEKRLEQGELDETGGRLWWRRKRATPGEDHEQR